VKLPLNMSWRAYWAAQAADAARSAACAEENAAKAAFLHRYVDEFAFRLNDGDVKRHTLERLASLVSASFGPRLTYKELTA
jgi:hypothetical protein